VPRGCRSRPAPAGTRPTLSGSGDRYRDLRRAPAIGSAHRRPAVKRLGAAQIREIRRSCVDRLARQGVDARADRVATPFSMNVTAGPGWGGARGVGTAGALSVAGAGTRAGVRARAGAGGILDDGRSAFGLRAGARELLGRRARAFAASSGAVEATGCGDFVGPSRPHPPGNPSTPSVRARPHHRAGA
jgi:hypothetical protein